jgi:integrase
MAETHDLMGGKLHVYRRQSSGYWQCSTYMNGRNWRISTKEDSLSQAKDFAEDWYIGLRGKSKAGELKSGKLFKQVAEQFLKEYEAIVSGERNPRYAESHGHRLRLHLLPFFGNMIVEQITPGVVQDYRIHRMTSRLHPKTGEPVRPSRSTLHHDIVTLRLVLKTANRHGWLAYIPDLTAPYRSSNKIEHRAWFSPEEYKQLYQATRTRAKNARASWQRKAAERLHDYVLFMVNTGLRPDEASRLEIRDVAIVTDEATGERILEIEVRGKRGIGYCKSMPGAVLPFQRTLKRVGDNPTNLLFGKVQRKLLNTLLQELGLKKDRDGNPRTAYSLRHTYICLRLLEGADTGAEHGLDAFGLAAGIERNGNLCSSSDLPNLLHRVALALFGAGLKQLLRRRDDLRKFRVGQFV